MNPRLSIFLITFVCVIVANALAMIFTEETLGSFLRTCIDQLTALAIAAYTWPIKDSE